jgi:hypothetical protein
VGSSQEIVKTFVYTLEHELNPKLRTPPAESTAWINKQLLDLKRRRALFFDTTVWAKDRSDLKKLAAGQWGMPCEEDEVVYQTNENLSGAAIIGLDGKFQFCVERNGRKWFGPNMVKSIMPA